MKQILRWRISVQAACDGFHRFATPNYQRFYAISLPTGVFLNLSRSGMFGGVFFLAEVRVQEGEPLENALRRFKRKVQTEDIIKEVKRHSFYLKPGEKKRVKEALARKRNRKKVRKEQD
jgi:small subunit ribosomal protein S21